VQAVSGRIAFALAVCALGALPIACASGVSSIPSAFDAAGTRAISSGAPPNTGGTGGGGGGGGGKAALPGALAFSSGCGQIDSVSSAAAVNPGLATVTITTKVAEHNCVNVYYSVDWVNTSTGVDEFSELCFNFTTTPYTCPAKYKTAQPNTVYETRILVWDATLPGSAGGPLDPASILGAETLTVTTAGAAPKQGA
jgi:hypothetical protein